MLEHLLYTEFHESTFRYQSHEKPDKNLRQELEWIQSPKSEQASTWIRYRTDAELTGKGRRTLEIRS